MRSESNGPPNDGPDEELRPVTTEIKRLLRRGRWIILGCTVAGLAFGLVKLRATESTYVASARVYLTGAELPAVGKTAQRLANQHFNAQLSMPLAALVSSEVIEGTIQQNDLTRFRTFQGVKDPVGHLIRSLDVGDSLPKQPGTPQLKFYGPDPREAEEILASLIDAYGTYYVEWQHRRNQAILGVLAEQKQRLQDEFNEIQDRRTQFQLAHDETALGSHDLNMRLQELNATASSLNALKLKRIDLEVTLAWLRATPRAESNRPIGLPEAVVDGHTVSVGAVRGVPDPVDQDRAWRLEKLRRDYGPDHPMYQEASQHREAQIREDLLRTNAEAERLSEQMDALHASLEQQRQAALAANRQVIGLKLIENDLTGVEQLLATVDDSVREIRFIDEYGIATVSVLERPHASPMPISPDSTRIVVMPTIVGCLLGLALAYWLMPEGREVSTAPSEVFGRSVGVPVLGVVRTASAPSVVVPATGNRKHKPLHAAEVRT